MLETTVNLEVCVVNTHFTVVSHDIFNPSPPPENVTKLKPVPQSFRNRVFTLSVT